MQERQKLFIENILVQLDRKGILQYFQELMGRTCEFSMIFLMDLYKSHFSPLPPFFSCRVFSEQPREKNTFVGKAAFSNQCASLRCVYQEHGEGSRVGLPVHSLACTQ